MATLIGIVSKVIGQVFAVASDGTRRALVEGDRLFAGEQLVTGAEGAVAVHLKNGQELTLGRDSSLQMTPQLLANESPHVGTSEAVTPSEAQLTDVEQLQKAIAAGADPTQTGEATAAGPGGSTGAAGGALGGGHSFVMLEEVGGRVDPTIGFPTAGFGSIPEFPEERHNADIQNADGTPAVVAPPLTPTVEVPPLIPVNNPVTLNGLSVTGGELTVSEANLADGSASNPGALTQNGTFSVSAPDGLNSLSIGGINVISGGVAAGFPQSITTQLGNTLTITGYNSLTGVVSYSYTLNGNDTHSAGDGANNLSEQFTVVAGDSNGDTATGTLDINITDDVPKAVDDGNADTASETLLTLTGSVLPNDTQGADRISTGPDSGPVIGGTFTGTYGTLVLNANGTYTYTLDTSGADFKALHGGGSGSETFTYTLTDADGDTSTANLVLQIHNNDDPVTIDGLNIEGAELTVFEKSLSDGSSPDASALTQNGTFTITALDGVQTLDIGGLHVVVGGVAAGFPQSIVTPLGSTLTITGFDAATGVVSYSYTLVDNLAHPTANSPDTLSEQFAVTVVDDNGTTANANLDINIVDDLPQGVDDSNADTASETLLTLNGNVLTNDVQGADRVITGENSGPITPGTFVGTYGTLVLNANGTYTYTLNTSDADFKALHGNGDGTENFTYIITDSDGDTSSATLVLQIHNNDDPVTIDGLNVNGGELTVYEKNLGDGSNPNTPALTQNGTFTITALDGVQTLDIGGLHVVVGGVAAGFPQSIVTPLGSTLTITGFDATTGVVSYSYTLVDNEAHPTANGANTLSEQFAVTVVDDNGTTANANLDVNIVDDLPKGVDDSNAGTASETLLTLNGNVLTNDVQGADRVTTGPNAGPITAGTFTGTYGTLVLNANGTYTYTLNTSDADFKALHGNGDGTETFTYTITDADGDTSTANLVLNIHNNDDPVTISGLDVYGGELTVYEKNLSDGSNPNTPALTQNGTFTITALDGVQTLDIGGLHVVVGGVAAGFPQSIVTPLGSTLTITGFDATTGVVSYSYTLVDNEAHPTANGANTLSEQFAVTVVDDNGTTANANLDVNIVDDLPKGVDDSNAGTASETLLTLNGNVLTNDVQGADRVPTGPNAGPITAGTFTGTYGTLVLNANGTYTYTLNTSDADFKALHGNGNGTETFTYTITDADGDTSTANLVLNIHNNDDPVTISGLDVYGGELTVYEKNLSDGSNPNTPALTQNGTFTITALDGVQTLDIGGLHVVVGGVAAGFPQSIVTPLGSTLTITGFDATTGVVSYSYTLVDNEAHPTANGANTLSEQFAVTVVDDNGTTANANLDVNIVDDLPKGVDDSNAGTASETLLTLNGNVLTNDVQGADRVPTGPNAGPITAGTFTGTYGTLVLNANGTYTYTLNTSDADFKALHGNGDGTENFTYTITDSDGDTSTATLVLQIHNNDDPVTIDGLNVNGGELTVYEKNLSDGSNPNTPALTQNGTFTITALDGVQTLDIGGLHVVVGGVAAGFPQSIVTPLGSTLTITGFDATTGVVSYSYTLVDNEAHPTANGANTLSEQFAVTVVDDNGTTANANLDVNIVDDLPKGVNDSNAGTASETLLTLNGNVLTNDVQGADRVPTGPNAGPITAGTFTGTYGTLVLNANGTYTYTLNTSDADFKALHGNGNGTETFTYTITDADGDTSTANLVLNIHNNDDPVTISGLDVYGGELTVYEKNLSDGSNPNTPALTQNGTFTITALDGVQTLDIGGLHVVVGGVAAGFPQSIVTPLGSTLTITGFDATTGVVSYSYTLVDNEAHPTANGANTLSEQFAVTVVDDNGTTANANLDVNIVDDLPKGVDDSNAGTASEILLTLNGNVLTNDVQGADRVTTGPNAGPITAGTFTGTYGTLVLNANGTYTYTLNTSDADFKALHGNGNGTETFTYTITDADGDTSTANLVLNIHNNDDPVTISGLDVYGGELTVYEKNLSDGSNPNTPALTQNGTFTVTALDGLQTLDIGGIHVVVGGVAAGFPQSIVTPLGSTLTITGYNPTTGVVSYSYTLVDNEAHPNANGANSLTENFNVVATDGDGSTASGQINVNIVDDLPTAAPNTANAAEGSTVNISVLGNDVLGADGAAVGGAVVGVRAGGNTGTPASGGVGLNINGTYGYLTLDAAGNAVYHSNPNSVGEAGATDTFTYTIRDSDGDESTTTITINITDTSLKAVIDQDVTVYEKALDLNQDGQDLAAGTVTGSDPGNTGETAAGTLVGSVTGGIGGLTYSLVGSATGSYGQILLNANGTYTYTLTSAPKTSPNANDGPNTLSESFTYKATDAAGNSVTSTIIVNIVDDVPTAVASDRSVAAVEIDSNILIVLDISGSMADDSGVPGLSRLELAKQAISALLDKYDDLGDVKVQLVTFSSTASDRTSVWVDVATAKTLLAGLSAGGGTNYDAAVAMLQTAFNTSGKLTGAQNVGYFFSDGKPTTGQDIGASDEATLKAFLDANGIKNYAIGLGSGVSNANLNPIAYDGSTHTDNNAVVVTDLNQLNSVLSGTVVGAPVTGTLLEGGTFGADGGFIKTLTVDGTTYTFDPKGNTNQGSLTFSGGVNHGTFNTVNNSISIATNNGGTLVVNLDTGEYTYTSQKFTSVMITENIGFTVSDNDGDLASSTLTVKVIPNAAPVAVDDHIITNVMSGNIVVPGELLLANDTDADKDPLTASPTNFATGWVAKGADFTGTGAINFKGTNDTAANQNLADVRNAFAGNTAAMTALLVVSGYLGQVTGNNANDEDLITVKLKAGETLNLDHNLAAGHITMEYSLNGGAFIGIGDGETITASADGTYRIHITNIENTSGGNAKGDENYQLTMSVNYAGAHDSTPDAHGTYTASDNHGGSDTAAVTITYQDGHTLTGTAGDDVMVAGTGNNIINAGDGNDVLTAGTGNNELHGGAGNDLLFSGTGNDLLDGGTGIDTVNYTHATAGVTVDLSLLTPQNTGGAGTDTLTGIENLVGSNFNDALTGDNNSNVINGGLGDDILKGGGGDDFMIGGLGNNTLTGGAGADTFQWLKGNSGHDVVTDFTPGTDKLDLSQLLQGENSTTASLDDYLHFKVVGSGASVITSIDVSAMAGATPNQTIDLAGVDLASHYGVTPGAGGVVAGGHDTATIITGMLNDHSLKVDTV
ncbi:retention module-containing protein [Pseudomonas sp. A-B-26]|uniref:retention module-containing protein n=1 Tax=Pseudomonas sp. A-B-26 TaxID=2832406 RepID=UPI001CBE64BA|nr:retention module-containing protein [Pseudomonas sp. A-B-26]